jgi:hypothetical protein
VSERECARDEKGKHDWGNEWRDKKVIECPGLSIPEEEEKNETRQIEGLQESACDPQRERDARNEGKEAGPQQYEDQFSGYKTPSNRNIGTVCCIEVLFARKR